jgi:regulator of G-protein signaling
MFESLLRKKNQLFFFFFILVGRRYFRDFLRSEYSEENFLFWMSCESLKNEQNPEIIEEKARLIYEDYISILSPKEVNYTSI